MTNMLTMDEMNLQRIITEYALPLSYAQHLHNILLSAYCFGLLARNFTFASLSLLSSVSFVEAAGSRSAIQIGLILCSISTGYPPPQLASFLATTCTGVQVVVSQFTITLKSAYYRIWQVYMQNISCYSRSEESSSKQIHAADVKAELLNYKLQSPLKQQVTI